MKYRHVNHRTETGCNPLPIKGLMCCFILLSVLVPAAGAATEAPLAKQLSREFNAIVQAVSPAIVNITTVRIIERGRPGPGRSPLDEFFFGPDGPFGEMGPPGQFRQEGLGSGVIISEDGYVLTNNHVVHGASELTVRLADRREFKATVVGTDPETDLAVLKVDSNGLPAAVLGDSDLIEVGDFILAIGNPFGLDRTVTVGIISAKGRANMGIAEYEDFIQTDAAINPGNSGGPVVNMDGQVIGVSTAIFSRGGGSSGIGFAVPINMARRIKDLIITEGHVTRGWLGVSIQNLTPELSDALETEHTKGALVADVLPESPAAEAGLQRGDLIVKLGDQELEDATDLRNRVAAIPPASETELTIIRDNKTEQITVKIGTRPRGGVAAAQTDEDMGFRVQGLNDEMRKRLNIPEGHGVLVTAVSPESDAYAKGIRPGSVILEVNRRRVENVEQFHEALGTRGKGNPVLLLVSTEGRTSYVVVQPLTNQ